MSERCFRKVENSCWKSKIDLLAEKAKNGGDLNNEECYKYWIGFLLYKKYTRRAENNEDKANIYVNRGQWWMEDSDVPKGSSIVRAQDVFGGEIVWYNIDNFFPIKTVQNIENKLLINQTILLSTKDIALQTCFDNGREILQRRIPYYDNSNLFIENINKLLDVAQKDNQLSYLPVSRN